eukprot:gb/GECG01001860.1/.p1 GENE.gb/GECG01001860.1/~~gb/GECG01001860.1/.p1  ORF type:complete len:122 (+),score=11.68 gb/GECG01001860.1/:1-366(+)
MLEKGRGLLEKPGYGDGYLLYTVHRGSSRAMGQKFQVIKGTSLCHPSSPAQWNRELSKEAIATQKAMRDLVLLLRTAATQNVSPQMLKQDLINLRTSAVVEPVAVVGLGLALGLIQVPERR